MSDSGTPANGEAPIVESQTPVGEASGNVPADADSGPADGEGTPPGTSSAPPAEGASEGDGPSGAPAAGEAQPEADPNASWKAKKYDKVFAKLRATEEELAAAKAGKPVVSQDEIQRQAQALAATTDFNRRCNEVAAEGAKLFPDFKAKIGDLRQVVAVAGDAQQEAAYGRLIEAVLETGDAAARVTYELGANLELAEEVMNLSPVKQAKRLAELAAKKGEAEPSNTPKPITPVGQKGGSGELIKPEDKARADNLSTKEWMARREADVAKKRAAGMRIW